MVHAARQLGYSYEAYLSLLEQSPFKLEYLDGFISAMAGGSPAHAALSVAVSAALRSALTGRCTVYSSDLKIRVDAANVSTFPDVSVICGAVQTATVDRNAAINPSLLVEVTSPATEAYDRGEKLEHYRLIPSLRAVLIVSHARPRVTVVRRTDDRWTEHEVVEGGRIVLDEPALELTIEPLYEAITLG